LLPPCSKHVLWLLARRCDKPAIPDPVRVAGSDDNKHAVLWISLPCSLCALVDREDRRTVAGPIPLLARFDLRRAMILAVREGIRACVGRLDFVAISSLVEASLSCEHPEMSRYPGPVRGSSGSSRKLAALSFGRIENLSKQTLVSVRRPAVACPKSGA
jgi:hypothetical protein